LLHMFLPFYDKPVPFFEINRHAVFYLHPFRDADTGFSVISDYKNIALCKCIVTACIHQVKAYSNLVVFICNLKVFKAILTTVFSVAGGTGESVLDTCGFSAWLAVVSRVLILASISLNRFPIASFSMLMEASSAASLSFSI